MPKHVDELRTFLFASPLLFVPATKPRPVKRVFDLQRGLIGVATTEREWVRRALLGSG
jgi:hypothetical protein